MRAQPAILPVSPQDASTIGALLALNNAHAQELSWLDEGRLRRLIAQSFLAVSITTDAFLLAFDHDASYDSPNFLWFRDRYARFVYIDRVVVSASVRGRGYARRLYEELSRHASSRGHDYIVCEVNAVPPNPASDAFHAALGFRKVGSATIHAGSKQVNYLTCSIA